MIADGRITYMSRDMFHHHMRPTLTGSGRWMRVMPSRESVVVFLNTQGVYQWCINHRSGRVEWSEERWESEEEAMHALYIRLYTI